MKKNQSRKKNALLSSKVLFRKEKKKKKKKKKCVHWLQSNQKFERKTCQCDVIKFKLAMFYRAELREYSYHVGEQAVLAKYSSCVPITWTMKERERGRVRKQEARGRKERRLVFPGTMVCIRNAIAFMAVGWQHDTA